MAILFEISNANDPRRAGIGRLVESLLGGLCAVMEAGEWQAGPVVCVSCWPHRIDGGLRERLECQGVRFFVLPSRSMYLYRIFRLPRWARRQGADLIVIPEPIFTPFSAPPFSVLLNDLLYRDDPASQPAHIRLIYTLLVPRTFRRARRIAAISQFTAGRARQLFPRLEKAIDVFPMTPCLHPSESEVRLPKGLPGRFALFVGTLIPRKNIRRLVRCFLRWKKEDPEGFIPLVIVGSTWPRVDPIDPWLDAQERRGIVRRLGYVGDGELAALYRNCAFFAFPSLAEGYGLPIIEAMAQGAPVLTSSGGAMEEAAGGAALLVDPENDDEILGAIRQLSGDEELRNELAEKGLKRASELTPLALGRALHQFVALSLEEGSA